MAIITMDMSSYEYSCEGAAEHEVLGHEFEYSPALGLQSVVAGQREVECIPASMVGLDVEHFLARMYASQS